MTGLRGAWWRAQEQEQARRPPARPENIENRFRQPKRWAPSTVLEPAIEHTRPGAEQRARTRPLCCQEACRTFFTAGDRRDGGGAGRVIAFGRVREWLGRRTGVLGCKPGALATESFPICPPGPASVVRPVTARASAWRWVNSASLIRRFKERSASFPLLPSAIFLS